jgi:hypothetical protein
MLCHQRRLPFFDPVLDQAGSDVSELTSHSHNFDRQAPAAVEASLVS